LAAEARDEKPVNVKGKSFFVDREAG